MTDFNRGLSTMKDDIICRIISIQNDMANDINSDTYKTLNHLIDMIEQDYGNLSYGVVPKNNESGELPKKTIRGFVGEYSDTWLFETDKTSYSMNVPKAIDEILGIESEDGEEYRITIEQVSKSPYSK